MKELKKCKGMGKALSHGCGDMVKTETRKYGLGYTCGCFQNWVKSTDAGRDYAMSFGTKISKENQKKTKKKESARFQEMKIESYGKENRRYLQNEINRLARMIDNYFGWGCIDCGKSFGNQQDGGHFHSVGSDAALRFNLHNVHSQRSECNQNGLGGGKALEYYEGLITRYGKEYADEIRFGLKLKYPLLKISNKEVYEKLVIARKLVRDFDKFIFNDAIHARTQLNKIIGLYN